MLYQKIAFKSLTKLKKTHKSWNKIKVS